MPGLGFRPLGYDIGGDVENPPMTHSQAMSYIKFIHGPEGRDRLPLGERIMDLDTLADFMAAWENDPEAAINYATKIQNLVGPIEDGTSMGRLSGDLARQRPSDRDIMRILEEQSRLSEERTGTMGRIYGTESPTPGVTPEPYTLAPKQRLSEELTGTMGRMYGLGLGPDVTQIDEVQETITPEAVGNMGRIRGPYMQAGGYVGRGTMAGELGRRGDLSVRQAGETMFERMKRLRGYAHGGYADGYSAPRGTVAGELPRYGDMSVREEGESMGELAKRHQDQDWYNHMGGGLGSLGRRRGIA
jgi:hypothetical protein